MNRTVVWCNVGVELKVIWKNWKLKNLKKFKIFQLDEDSESKLICIQIGLILITDKVYGWNLDWIGFYLFVVEKLEI